jgi:hypothetical protein
MQTINTNTNTDNATASSHELDQLVSDLQTVLSSALKQRIGGLFQEYALYKETHDAVMRIPAVVQNTRKLIHDQPQDQNDASASSAVVSDFEVIIRRITLENDHLKAQLAAALSGSSNSNPQHGANIRLIVEEATIEPLASEQPAVADAEKVPELDLAESENGNSIVSIVSNDAEEETDEEEEEEEESEEEEEEEEVDAEAEEEEVDAEAEEEEVEEEEAEEEEVEEAEVEEAEAEEEEAEEEEEEAEVEAEVEAEEEEVEEEEVEEEEVEEEEAEEEEAEEEEAEEEVEVIEITIKGKSYFTTNETNGIIYECTRDGDIGNEVGKFEGGRPKFNKK